MTLHDTFSNTCRCDVRDWSKIRNAIHTHFVTLIGKWTILGVWVKYRANKRGKVAKLRYTLSDLFPPALTRRYFRSGVK